MPRSPSNSGSVSPPRNRPVNRSTVQKSPARSPPPPVQEQREPRLFVSGLSLEVTQEDVRNLFSTHGQIMDFFMKKNQRGGIAFITFGTIEEADKAKECHGAQLDGKSIRVDFAKPRSSNNDRGNNRQRPPRNNGQFNRCERTKVCQRKPKICFKCQKEGHFSKQCTQFAKNNHQGLHQRRHNQEIKPFRRREVIDNRQTFSRKVNTQTQDIFPPGRQDYVYQESNTEDLSSSRGNKFPQRTNIREMPIVEPQIKRPFARKRSISRSESPAKKHYNVSQLETSNRNKRKKSVSHSPSPIRNRVKKDDQEGDVKKGLAECRQANVSRSRSRSRQRVRVTQRKRSVSKDSSSY